MLTKIIVAVINIVLLYALLVSLVLAATKNGRTILGRQQ